MRYVDSLKKMACLKIHSILGSLSNIFQPNTLIQEGIHPLESTFEKRDEGRSPDLQHYRDLIDRLSAVRSSKKKAAEYKIFADKLFLNLKELVSPYWSDDYKILTGGASNLLTAKVYKDGKPYFVKVTKNRKDSEFKFYNSLLDGLVPESGDFYKFIKPINMSNDEHIRVYIFPFFKIKIIQYNDENILFTIMALAEITAQNRSLSLLRQSRLPRHRFELTEDALKAADSGIMFNDKDEKHAAIKRHKEILADWDSVTLRLKKLKFSLCNRDIRQENLAIVDSKLTLFDMGSVALAPPGVDLYQLIHETKDIFSRTQICRNYADALKERGMKRSAKDIEMAACAASAYKWLNVSERDASTLKAKNYLYALDCAEFCTRLVNRES